MADKLLKDYAAPCARGVQSNITRPSIDADNFEIKPAVNEVPPESVRLLLFIFSLKDGAKQWLNSLPANNISSWEQCEQKFLDKFYPLSKTAHMRNLIASFKQIDSESLFEAWTDLRACRDKNQMKALGKFEVDAFTLMSAKLDALTKKFKAMGSNTVNAIVCACDIYGSVDHAQDTCPLGPMQAQINQLEQCDAITGPGPTHQTYQPEQQTHQQQQPTQLSRIEKMLEKALSEQKEMRSEIKQLTQRLENSEKHQKMQDS
ncbi:uncharacterized protein LOC122010814 [Zingiber officinale]|uniref:uncharacterized protein LOC122010814 n=1 Tax=Zingiber officinale TaxID=94328 RepID=UPI001C4C754D|nr:uncharacterized protein LOC122010814 [Zingiber officinale]